jgi:serine/threonine protein kinase
MNVTRIGDYEIISKLGEGGMGAVFKARQISLDRVVALKVLPPKLARDASFIERFQREARATAKLNHPHIVAGIGVGEEKGFYYLAMEYVDGATLKSRINREGQLPEKDVLRIGIAMASALAHAHSVGLVHRDVKPDNILIASDGTPKLADLGLAKGSRTEDASLTQSGCAVGTPHYIAPEQAGGEELDGRADAYSLGCTLYHALTGRVPFEGTAVVLLVRHMNEKLPHPQVLRPDMSNEMCAILAHLVARDRRDRYANLEEAVEDMSALLAGETPTRKPLPAAKVNFLTSTSGAGSARNLKPAERTGTRRQVPVNSSDRLVRNSSDRLVRPAPRQKQWLPFAVSGGLIALVGGFLLMNRASENAVASNSPSKPPVAPANTAPQNAAKPPALPPVFASAPPKEVKAPPASVPKLTEPERSALPAVTRAPVASASPEPTPINTSAPMELPLAAADSAPTDAIQLFNGRDLTGWNIMAPPWTVEDGAMVGRGPHRNASIGAYNVLPRQFELTLVGTATAGFHVCWSTTHNSDGASHLLQVDADGSVRLMEYTTTSKELVCANKKIKPDAQSFRIIVRGRLTTIEVDGVLFIKYNETPLTDDPKRDVYIFAWPDSTFTLKKIYYRDASNLAPAKPAVDPAVAEKARREKAESDARQANLSLHEGLLSAARNLDAKACAAILASAEKDEKLKSFAAELKEEETICGWIDDLLAAEIEGAKKLSDVDDFELRLMRGEPMHVGKRAPFKLVKAEKGIVEIGSGGMSFQKPVAQLAFESRYKLAEMGLGSDASGLVRRAFVAVLTAQAGDKKALAAATAAVEKAKSAQSDGPQLQVLGRLLKCIER